MSGDTEREALTEVIAGTYTVFSDDHGELADAILTKFMPDHDKRVKAEVDAKLDAVRKHVGSMSGDPEHPIEAWHRESLLAILDRREGF